MKAFLWTIVINNIWLRLIIDALCLSHINETTCLEEKMCEGSININGIYLEQSIVNVCQHSLKYVYNIHCLPINLIYKDHDTNEISSQNEKEYNGCIKFLDISNDNYVEMPKFAAMDHLVFINISFNLITTAKLSSQNRLPSLNELDISNNLINKIEIDSNEFGLDSLTKLHMSYNKLSDLTDANFYGLNELQFLDLSHNEITHMNAFTFEGIKNVLNLNLSHNKMKDINTCLFRFTKLNYLYVNNNELSNVLLADFKYLNEIIEIDLSYNVISSIEKNVFDNMPLLNRLNLKKNLLNIIEPLVFSYTVGLKFIDLSLNEISKLPKYLFKGKSLSFFDISQNCLEGELARGTFEGLVFVEELDISHQRLTSIEDFAFVGLDMLQILKLNSNKILNISKHSFHSLRNLRRLDLSGNQIHDLNFEVIVLLKLKILSLKFNFIGIIAKGHFDGLSSMEMLDVSYNNISTVESFSLKDLSQLTNFDISKNPLSKTLENNTFMGLAALPSLDISCTSLTIIKNNSFNEMANLRTLNISHGNINEVRFNSFINTGNINVLDLSHNLLKVFFINTTTVINLEELYLDSNLIEIVSLDFVTGLLMISVLNLGHNNIISLYDGTFRHLKRLVSIDISYNPNLIINATLLDEIPTVKKITLSGTRKPLIFNDKTQLAITDLDLSKCDINNITTLRLNVLQDIHSLSINNNNVQKLEVGAFNNLTTLRYLDLSQNKLLCIQPGVFKDNYNLNHLNISHNNLDTLSYGIFRGLSNLGELDLSHNLLVELKSERFYGISSLHTLIVDFNRISSVDIDEFSPYLSVLSIGGNLIHCDNLIKLNNIFNITAVTLDVTYVGNIDGVSCVGHIKKNRIYEMNGTENVLTDIRDILLKLSTENKNDPTGINSAEKLPINTNTLPGLLNQTIRMAIHENVKHNNNSELIDFFSQSLTNITHEVTREQSRSNSLLERILKMFVTINKQTTPLPVLMYNTSNENIGAYIAKVKQDLENSLTIEKEKILAEVSDKILLLNNKIESQPTVKPSQKLAESREMKSNSISLFTEVCVALILLILLCFIVFKIYQYVILSPRQRSYSTQHIADAITNSNL